VTQIYVIKLSKHSGGGVRCNFRSLLDIKSVQFLRVGKVEMDYLVSGRAPKMVQDLIIQAIFILSIECEKTL
jgi:hypothetical protein